MSPTDRSIVNALRKPQVFSIGSQSRRLSLLRQRLDARQLLPFQELQRRPAAGRDVGNAISNAGIVHRRNRVPAADDRRSTRIVDHGIRDLLRTASEWHFFENTHRAVPYDGLGD